MTLIAKATRKSIKKHMALGAVMGAGSSNPLTIHDCDDDLFRAVWCLLGETMVVGGELDRVEKEEIATMVSQNNKCTVCVTAHVMMATAAKKKKRDENIERLKKSTSAPSSTSSGSDKGTINGSEDEYDQEERSKQAVAYAELVQKASQNGEALVIRSENDFSLLNDIARAECALVVLLFQHMNRVISAIMGEQMTTAMMGLPRTFATQMEKPGVMKHLNRMMKPIISGAVNKSVQPGFTNVLFKNEKGETVKEQEQQLELPEYLQGVKDAGLARAHAVGRLYSMVDVLYMKVAHVVPKEVIDLVDAEVASGSHDDQKLSPVVIVSWIQEKLGPLSSKNHKIVATIMILVAYFPRRIFNSKEWRALVDDVTGGDVKMARMVVIWYSLRLTMMQAKGFQDEGATSPIYSSSNFVVEELHL